MDEVAARADAKAIADMKPFAVLNGANQTPAWSDELAANGIMCLGNCSLAVPESFVKDHAPLRLRHRPDARAGGDADRERWSPSCSRARRPSSRGDALKDKKRVFGVVHYDTDRRPADRGVRRS